MRGKPRKEPCSQATTMDDLISSRSWLLTALCVMLGGWFGAQRFYLGRYVGGVLRLALFIAAVYCGRRIVRGDGGMIQPMVYMVLAGAGFDLLMIVAGPALMRRRMMPVSFFTLPMLISRHPIPRINGTWLTLPAVALLLVYLCFTNKGIAAEAKVFSLGFIGFSISVGVYWMRDCLHILYWRNLTDGSGRLPL